MKRSAIPTGGRFLIAVLLSVGFLASAWAQPAAQSKRWTGFLDDLQFARPECRLTTQLKDTALVRQEASSPAFTAYDALLSNTGVEWRAVFDGVTGRVALAEGSLPWIPGTGNSLTWKDLGRSDRAEGEAVSQETMARKALDFVAEYRDLLGASPDELALIPGASGPISDYLYFVDFQWTYHGLPVERAHVVFRLNHGNLVQFGQECISRTIESLDPAPAIDSGTAWEMLWGYLGDRVGEVRILDPGRLFVMPVSTPQALAGTPVRFGSGMEYRLVYLLSFEAAASGDTWEARVDAHTGEVLSFTSADELGAVHGGVYPSEQPVAEVSRALPFADLGGGLFADAGGLFAGNSATSTLAGQYVTVSDKCGAISLTTANGNLDFGSGAGTNCTTPGFGGAGNTHASRTLYYTIDLFKRKARAYMPANGWLNGNVTGRVNLTAADSAYCPGNGWWDGVQINLCISDASYGNTGEEPGFLLHEIGHGLDSNDGNGGSPENGTGEAYGDTNAFLISHNSCVGSGFRLTGNCGYGGENCTGCNGLRDVDWANHTTNTAHTVDNFTRVRCWSDPYSGPCGYEGHCEAAILTEAVWDLAARDLTAAGFDAATAWMITDKLWFRSRSTATQGFACNTGAIPWTSNGCAAGSLYTVLRAVDDTDGNPANGTLHAAAIFAALSRHGIACGAAGDPANQNQGGCPAIGTPALSGTLGTNQVSLSWTAAANAASYEIYRNEISCGAGFMQLGTVAAPTLTYTDTTALGGIPYYYRVQAVGATAACMGSMSNCLTIGGALSGTASGAPLAGVAPLTVNFTGAGLNGTPPYTYSWSFGDGSPNGSGATPSHAYAVGNWTAQLTITDSGTPNQTFAPSAISISAAPPLTVTSSADRNLGEDPAFLVNFTSGPAGGFPPYTYSWNFGDGSPLDTTANPAHTFTAPGVYTVALTVKDSGLPQNTASAPPLTITVLPHVTATAAAVPIYIAPGSPVSFAGTGALGQGPYTYAWDFGDGTPAGSGTNPTHAYAAVGDYPVTLTVTDSLLYTAVDSHLLIHVCMLACSATVPATGVVAFPVTFTATATLTGSCPGPITYAWDFGDGGTAATQNATHTYAAGGTFTWTLTVTANGLTCSQTGTIKICPYNISAADEYGRSRLCFNTITGAWQWIVLRGPGIGTYTGVATVSFSNGTYTLTSLPGEPWTLSVKYMQFYKKASASFTYRLLRFTSVLVDNDTTNNPLCCP